MGRGAAAAGHRREYRGVAVRSRARRLRVFFRGIEKDRTLDDPYFFPVYEEAQALDLAICVHQGQGAPGLNNLVDITRSHTFTHGRLPPLSAFRNIVANRIPSCSPSCDSGSSRRGRHGVPFVLHQLSGTMQVDADWWGPRLFDEYRLWVSYEVDEDLPYLLRYIGEDHVVTGTDYGHHGSGTNRLAAIRRRRLRWCGRSGPGRSTAAAPSTSCSSTTRVRCTAWRRGRFLFRSR